MVNRRNPREWARGLVIWAVVAATLLGGCQQEATLRPALRDFKDQKTFLLSEIPPEKAAEYISALGLTATVSAEPNTIVVAGSPAQLQRAALVLELVDGQEQFIVQPLVSAARARNLPSNEQIAQALGEIVIGTFVEPPPEGPTARGIVDIHGEHVIAVIPARLRDHLVALVNSPRHAAEVASLPSEDDPEPPQADSPAQEPPVQADSVPLRPEPAEPVAPTVVRETPEAEVQAPEGRELVADPSGQAVGEPAEEPEPPKVISLSAERKRVEPEAQETRPLVPVANGDDTLDLDLPPILDLVHLLDLAAEYLDLDYMYEPSQVNGQTVTLKLHGKLQGQIRIKDLYPLLESVLKFKGFAMTRHEGRIVTVVPLAEALQLDPKLVGRGTDSLAAGEMVITRVLELQYVDALSATQLLDDMKLSVAVSPIEETRSLIVTSYAHRMARIEELLRMIDRPGRAKQFRSRQLRYTMAGDLVGQLMVLAQEFEDVPVTIAPLQKSVPEAPQAGRPGPPGMQAQTAARSVGPRRMDRDSEDAQAQAAAVYLDADERTNRILMLGYEEQVELVEQLIDALDLPEYGLQRLQAYHLEHVQADKAAAKLEGLGVIGGATEDVPQRQPTPPGQPVVATASRREPAGESMTVEGPQVVVLAETNALLVNATDEQHARIERTVRYLDVVYEDQPFLRVYDIQYVDAEDVRQKLGELGAVAADDDASRTRAFRAVRSAPEGSGSGRAQFAVVEEGQGGEDQPRVVVREGTNSLVVFATEEEHVRIAETIRHLDAEALEQAIPYEIYFLENQEPNHIAEVLQNIIQEMLSAEQDKIQPSAQKAEDKIIIVPDKGTFSVIVYASRKNQEWISKLITALDKRRPQVLIDVTLVEITETDAFNYDLDIIRGWSDLDDTAGVSGFDPDEDMIGTFARSAGGSLTAFYGDRQVQALLTAVQSKNYGRVLAKPKVLVNDNQPGLIKTTDTTYVETRSSIPVSSGSVGNEQNFVETSVQYEAYDAGITLDITPHISEGDLLRLDISLTRSDFLPTENDRPPNTTASEVNTAVTVPDGSTIILGGLLKLNQSKGDTKVPLLGDVPFVGGLFRGASASDKQSKLYVFVKAEIIRPAEQENRRLDDLAKISERNREAFEEHEHEFQSHQTWPGVEPEPMPPARVLDAR